MPARIAAQKGGMSYMPPSPELRFSRLAPTDPAFAPLERAFTVFARPAPTHLLSCRCALCADRDRATSTAGRPARHWSDGDVLGWFGGLGPGGATQSVLRVASRTDHAVFRFLLPRVLEMLAAGGLPPEESTLRVLAEFRPGRMAGLTAEEAALLDRIGALVLDRALSCPEGGTDLFGTLQLLAHGGWPLRPRLRQALADPELPAALARVWGRTPRRAPLIPGLWPEGAAAELQAAFVTGRIAELLMNFAMAHGTTADEMDDAMRAADRLLA
jgi:hypothetical protein